MKRSVLSLTIVLLCCGFALAQAPQQPEPPAARPADDQRLDGLNKPEPEQPKADQSWWQRIVRETPFCKSFTDGCRTCSDSYVCSNIGIACQPKDWSCNDLSKVKPDATPEARPDDKPKQ
jgi:hypothetical protein